MKQYVYGICVACLVMAVCVQAQVWTNGGGDQLWSNPANWDPQEVPSGVQFGIDNADIPGPIIKTDVTLTDKIWISTGATDSGELTVDGGNVTAQNQIVVTQKDNANGTFTIKSGSVTTGAFSISWRGQGTINMLGGLFTVNGDFKFTNKASSDATLNLMGGKIRATNLMWIVSAGSENIYMDVTGGVMVLDGDERAVVQEGIDKGFLVAYGGNGGEIIADYNEVDDVTTISALHTLRPVPSDGGIVLPTTSLDLAWTLPEGATAVDVYVTDDYDALHDFTDPESMLVVDKQNVSSVNVPVEVKKTYYWAVDVYMGDNTDPNYGPIFKFSIDHEAPIVDAGSNVITFLQDGTVTGPLVGTVTDDGFIQPYTVEWTIVSEPNSVDFPAVIEDPTSEITNVTMTTAGTYELKLTADDGEKQGLDTMRITVHETDWNPVN